MRDRIIIFQCYGGTHSSVISAYIFTGRLPRGRLPAARELDRLPYFERLTGRDIGNLHYAGKDDRGNRVYCLGSDRFGKEIRKLVTSFFGLPSPAPAPVVAVIDCLPQVTFLMRLGGYLSRRLGISVIGRPLVYLAVRRNYYRHIARVEEFETNPEKYLLNRPE